MKRFLFATLLCAIGHCAYGADADGDGLLDVIDVAGFDANASGNVGFQGRGIQDIDGTNLLANAKELDLGRNQITGLESGDFQGLSNLQELNRCEQLRRLIIARFVSSRPSAIEPGACRWLATNRCDFANFN
jgi:hypothetical protein